MALTTANVFTQAMQLPATLIFGPAAHLPWAWDNGGKQAAIKAGLIDPDPAPTWAPLQSEPDNTLLWVLAAIAGTGILIAVLRK